jgi:hypothetical protein
MLRNLLKERQQEQAVQTVRRDLGLQVVLWTLWTFAVVAVGYFNWHADVVAQRPINTLGLVIHCVVAGVIGLVIMTKIEMHLEPWRFFDA